MGGQLMKAMDIQTGATDGHGGTRRRSPKSKKNRILDINTSEHQGNSIPISEKWSGPEFKPGSCSQHRMDDAEAWATETPISRQSIVVLHSSLSQFLVGRREAAEVR